GSAAGPALPERRDAPRRCPGPAPRAVAAGLPEPVAAAQPEPITHARTVAHRVAQGVGGTDEEAERETVPEGHTEADQEAVTQGRGRSGGRPGEDVSALDKRIIEHLQADGRRPFTQIAADLGVSEAAVRARTNRLIERDILQVVGVTDPLKLGFHQMAMIGIRCQSDKLIAVAEHLAAMPEVDYVVITAGTYDILIETVCEDNEGLFRFLAERLRTIDG